MSVVTCSVARGQSAPDWRKLGNSSVELGLASAASGPVMNVWFSASGDRIFIRTATGKTWESADFESWQESTAVRADAGSRTRVAARGRLYQLGSNVYSSDDNGHTWINITGVNDNSVIGSGQHDLAVSPKDPQTLVVANNYGLWRSLDGGMSWAGLNESLPNLPVREIVAPIAGAGLKIALAGLGTAELPAGGQAGGRSWQETSASKEDGRSELSQRLGTRISALAGAGDIWYAGSEDGRIWVSADNKANWTPGSSQAGAAIERFFVNAEAPRIALAAVAGREIRILRTINRGQVWDDASGNLPDGAAHSVTADIAAGVVYAATDRGAYMARMDLNVLGPVGSWTPVTAKLPAARVMDVKLDSSGNQLLVALEGYGVYAAPAPHRAHTLRLVNAADLSQRAAAPGSLYSVLGGQVLSVRAGDTNFPMLASSPEASQIQIPFDVSAGPVRLSLEQGTGPVTLGLSVKAVSPAVFLDRDGSPMLLDAETGLMLDTTRAARAGSRIQVLATGLGSVRPAWPTGVPAPADNPPEVVAAVEAFAGKMPLEVLRATLAPGYVGLYLIEVQLPSIVDAGFTDFYLSAAGQESNHVRLLLEAMN